MQKLTYAKQIETVLSDNGINLHTVAPMLAAYIIFGDARDKLRHPSDVASSAVTGSAEFAEKVVEHVTKFTAEYAEAYEHSDYVASELGSIIDKLTELENCEAYKACIQAALKIPNTFNTIKDDLNAISETVEDL